DQTLKTTLSRYGGTANRQNFYSLFMCMENPHTGDVLAISGYQMNPTTRQLSYFASGNYTNLVNPGSCVKGVSVYMGQSEGVLEEGEVIYDARLNVGGRELGSFHDHGPVSDVSALSVSSNVYMFHIAMRLAGFDYAPGKAFEVEDVEGTIEKMRQYYSLFGLGNVTGIDVPGEVSVYSAGKNDEGMILNYVIGQLDTYTPLQMMQYAGVIGSNGKMYQPHFYQYAKEVNSNEIFDVQENFLKSVLPEENASHLSRVQEGFAACVVDGNCGTPLQKMSHNMAAKTGTAEVGEWTTANLIGYGPVENPTIAYACSAPTSSVNSQNVSGNICTTDVVGPVLDKYFELYPQ
ncbi:MAG: penicillin-binding protein 2, partial [Allobaculum sp.]|nr:penicillin-binding protein 2 [Allobaculum sp.]